MDLELKNKVAVVTGGSIGIGNAVAQGLAREGVHLVLCARDEAAVKKAAAELSERFGVRAFGFRADVSKANDIDWLVAEVSG